MKNTRRRLAGKSVMTLILTLVFVFSLSFMAFAAKAKVEKKSLSMDQGVSMTVSAGKKASWKSGNKSIVTLKVSSNRKKAVLKAVGKGKTTVTAAIGKKKKIVWNVTVEAAASGSAPSASASAAGNRAALRPTDTSGMTAYEAAAYQTMVSMAGSYPEGMSWPNTASTYYAWSGGIWRGGYGCASFTFRLSDAAFGSARARRIMVEPDRSNVNEVIHSWLHVGDIIRTDSDGMKDAHSVIVMKKTASGIVVAEGNYGGKVHWGRTISYKELSSILCYVVTRYNLDDNGTILG